MRYHVLAVLVLLTFAPVNAAAVTTGVADGPACFPSTGYQFGATVAGTGVELEFHTSLLATVRQPGGLGIETSGQLRGRTVVGFRVGVAFAGFQTRSAFSSQPLDAFSIPVEFAFHPSTFTEVIPGGDASTDDFGGPITGSVCGW